MLDNFLIENVKRIYVINLKHRSDRLSEFENRCKKLFKFNLVQRIEAIYGENINKEELCEDFLKKAKNKGEIGCFLSHRSIWEKIMYDHDFKDNDLALIFEDDVFFNEKNFQNNFEKAVHDFKKINNVSKLLYIGGRFKPNFNLNNDELKQNWKHISNSSLKERIYDSSKKPVDLHFDRTTHSYIITKKTAKMLFEISKNNSVSKPVPVDIFLVWFAKYEKELKTYDVFPHLCYSPADYKTDIVRK